MILVEVCLLFTFREKIRKNCSRDNRLVALFLKAYHNQVPRYEKSLFSPDFFCPGTDTASHGSVLQLRGVFNTENKMGIFGG